MTNQSNISGILDELKLAVDGSTLSELNRADINEAIVNLREMVMDRFELQEADEKGDKDSEDDSSTEDEMDRVATAERNEQRSENGLTNFNDR